MDDNIILTHENEPNKNIRISLKKQLAKQILMMFFGCMLTGFAISCFNMPNKIVGGGVSGITTILFHTLDIPPGLSFAVINLSLLILGFKTLGKEFILKTLVGAGLISLFVQIFVYIPPVTHNVVLASIFGGTLYGLGLGITFISGASTGGTDILGRLFQHWFPSLKIGKALLVIDGIIIFSSLLVFKEVDLTLFGIITLCVQTYIIDWIISKLNISRLAFIITDFGEEIANHLIHTSPRGVTKIDVIGSYSNKDKKLLLCALKEKEVVEFHKKINEFDPDAFVIFAEAKQIWGEGFKVYK